jgi:hypothetical protein
MLRDNLVRCRTVIGRSEIGQPPATLHHSDEACLLGGRFHKDSSRQNEAGLETLSAEFCTKVLQFTGIGVVTGTVLQTYSSAVQQSVPL